MRIGIYVGKDPIPPYREMVILGVASGIKTLVYVENTSGAVIPAGTPVWVTHHPKHIDDPEAAPWVIFPEGGWDAGVPEKQETWRDRPPML